MNSRWRAFVFSGGIASGALVGAFAYRSVALAFTSMFFLLVALAAAPLSRPRW